MTRNQKKKYKIKIRISKKIMEINVKNLKMEKLFVQVQRIWSFFQVNSFYLVASCGYLTLSSLISFFPFVHRHFIRLMNQFYWIKNLSALYVWWMYLSDLSMCSALPFSLRIHSHTPCWFFTIKRTHSLLFLCLPIPNGSSF